MIKISIIVPVYNVEKYLKRCLDSLINQTLKDIEIIVINDASPDDSDTIMRHYEALYPEKIKCIYLDINRCQGGARNIGIEMAQGEFLMFVDADDYVDVTICEKLYVIATEHDYDTVYCDYYREDENTGKRYWTSFMYDNLIGELNNEKRLALVLTYYYGVAQIIHKSLFQDGSLRYPENVKFEDSAFAVKHFLQIKWCGKLSEPLYTYVIRDDSTCGKNNIQNSYDMYKIARIVLEYGKTLSPQQALMTKYASLKICVTTFERFLNFLEYPAKDINTMIEEIEEQFSDILYSRLLYTFDRTDIVDFLVKRNKEHRDLRIMEKSSEQIYYSYFEKEINQFLTFIVENNDNILLWGAGKRNIQFLKQFDSEHTKIKWVTDINSDKWGAVLETGHEVLNFRDVINQLDVVITTNRNFTSFVTQTIQKFNKTIQIIDLESMIISDCIQEIINNCCLQ